MEYTFAFAVISLLLNVAFSQNCQTPLGVTSQCVTINNCPSLAEATLQRPMPEHVQKFLRHSHCGFDGSIPKVCCGLLPEERSRAMRQTVLDPVNQEDSYPSRRGECGLDAMGERILGGEMMNLDEFPWMVLLGYREWFKNGEISYLCSGGLINHRYVMTAAHCVTGVILTRKGPLVNVRLGEYDTRREIDCMAGKCGYPVQDIPVHKSYPHHDYAGNKGNNKNDIAMVRLTRRVRFTDYVKPICLPKPGSRRVWPGDEVFVAGWGKTSAGGASSVKLKVGLSIFNKAECVRKFLEKDVRLTKRQICAGGVQNEDSCQGDSGGPLVMRTVAGWVAVGVVSFGFGCGQDGWPGVYTSVPSYVAWVQSILVSSNENSAQI